MTGLVAGLDCSGETFSVGLAHGGEVLAEVGGLRPRAHLALLFPALQEAARMAGASLRDLEAVAVTTGPGSFTGLRLGIVTARTLAQATGCAAVPVDTLEALAMNAPGHPRVVPALDARRGEIFAASYSPAGRLSETRAYTPEALRQALAGWGGGVVVGSAVARYGDVLAEAPGVALLPPAYAALRGGQVALLGARGTPVPLFELDPRYLRSAEVQVHGVQK